ncbi:MAG: hypothetical protein HYU81_02910 [Candidatus Brennerbacteria bacterium]|nr:hypothetical protein [Candidatus Brennerbacteria bacterium]
MKLLLLKLLMWKLRLLARLTILRYTPGVVAVTGNVGKTSAKEAIGAVLARRYRVRAAAKSFNNELGVPLTIISGTERSGGVRFWCEVILTACYRLIVRDPEYPEVLVLEYAIDRPGDMDRLVRIAAPDVAVVTAMGDIPVHVEFFAGPEMLFREKTKLVKAVTEDGFAVLNADDPKVASAANLVKGRVITFGFGEEAGVKLMVLRNVLENGNAELRFKLSYGGAVVPVRMANALGAAAAYAAGAAAAVGIAFRMNLAEIAAGLESCVTPPGRLRAIPGIRGTLLVDSTYNASPLATKDALDTLKELGGSRKIAVVGDMLELGKFTVPAHEEIGTQAAKVADVLVTVGHRAKFAAEAALAGGMSKGKIHSFLTLADAAHYLDDALKEGDVVLFKASQGVRLERVVKRFMREPMRAEELLVRQEPQWFHEKGLYDDGELE